MRLRRIIHGLIFFSFFFCIYRRFTILFEAFCFNSWWAAIKPIYPIYDDSDLELFLRFLSYISPDFGKYVYKVHPVC